MLRFGVAQPAALSPSSLTGCLAGLHDIAAVLLFVLGSELAAYRTLRALASTHLRDCTRPDLAAATETLSLLYPILEQVRLVVNELCSMCIVLLNVAGSIRHAALVCTCCRKPVGLLGILASGWCC